MPSKPPSERLSKNHPPACISRLTLVDGANAKMAPAATSGARSSAAAISTRRSETGPCTFQRTATHWTTKRVVSAVTAPAPAARRRPPARIDPRDRDEREHAVHGEGDRAAREHRAEHAEHHRLRAHAAAPDAAEIEADDEREPARARPARSARTRAIIERSTSPSAWGPTAKPSPRNSTPDGRPRAVRPPMIRLPT